ncbi:MAG TPA: GNAT family N-acetyltransferase [Gemmatimonadales bacterium]|nr:GNAT family N-acetyltransferase [Gemmatimonadales bacterium]
MATDRPPDRRLTDRPVITPAQASDLAAILALLASHGLPDAGLAEHLPTALVARVGAVSPTAVSPTAVSSTAVSPTATVVGCAAIEPYDGAGLLRSVAVAEPQRGTGLGMRLTEAAIRLAEARGIRALYLLTETAAGFFPRFGFRPIPRDEVAPAVRQSIEFTRACPASAMAMVKEL